LGAEKKVERPVVQLCASSAAAAAPGAGARATAVAGAERAGEGAAE
jgi:hypothetical protein